MSWANLLADIERDKRRAVVLFDSADPDVLPRPLRHRPDGALADSRCRDHGQPTSRLRTPHSGSGASHPPSRSLRSAGAPAAPAVSSCSPPTSVSPAESAPSSASSKSPSALSLVAARVVRLPRASSVGAARSRSSSSGRDFDGDLAERYGYVNRAIPDAQFVGFVDPFARRVSRFDRLALADIKRFVNAVSLPADEPLPPQLDAFWQASARPGFPGAAQPGLQDGYANDARVELRLGEFVGPASPTPALPHPLTRQDERGITDGG